MEMILVACADLMTASRFSANSYAVMVCRSEARLLENLGGTEDSTIAYVLVDLAGFADLPRKIRDFAGENAPRIVGFAPHVREDLLGAGREVCDEVVVRGAAVKRFPEL